MATSAQDVADWITKEMRTNLAGKDFQSINGLLRIGTFTDPGVYVAKTIVAGKQFYDLVKTGGPWDHKKPVRQKFGEWSDDPTPPRQYRFDIWSNVHYGYIGRACGFSTDLLLDAAGAAQAGHSTMDAVKNLTDLRKFDDPLDQEAIKVGFWLWGYYREALQTADTMNSLRVFGALLATRAR